MLTEVSREVEFDVAHRLLDSPESPCFETHGHRYKVIAYVTGFLNNKGEVLDFHDLKQILMEEVHQKLDHQFINLIVEETNATVERLVNWMWSRIAFRTAEQGAILTKLTCYETPTCKAERVLDTNYIAGMLDADGNISQSGNIEIQMRINNTDKAMLYSIALETGAGTMQGGKINDGLNGQPKGTKPCYSLVFPRRAARVLCALVLPYLRIKKEQAEICIQYTRCETGQKNLPREEWEKRAELLTKLSKANGHSRIFTADGMITQQEKFRQNRRDSAKRSRLKGKQ